MERWDTAALEPSLEENDMQTIHAAGHAGWKDHAYVSKSVQSFILHVLQGCKQQGKQPCTICDLGMLSHTPKQQALHKSAEPA